MKTGGLVVDQLAKYIPDHPGFFADMIFGAVIAVAAILIVAFGPVSLPGMLGLGLLGGYLAHVLWRVEKFKHRDMIEESVEDAVEDKVKDTVEDAVEESVDEKVGEIEETVDDIEEAVNGDD